MSSKDDPKIGDTNDIMGDTNAGKRNNFANVLCVSGNHRTHEGYAESGELIPLQQLRTFLQCFDNQLENHPIFTHPLFTEIFLSILESEDAVQH